MTYKQQLEIAEFELKHIKETADIKVIQEKMQRHNIKIDNLDDKMQKFAFTLYSHLAHIDNLITQYFKDKQ